MIKKPAKAKKVVSKRVYEGFSDNKISDVSFWCGGAIRRLYMNVWETQATVKKDRRIRVTVEVFE